MLSGRKIHRIIIWLGVAILQLIMTQVVTFLASMLLPGGMEGYQQTDPDLFVLFLGLTFTTGVFLAGWLAIRRHWITLKPKYLSRLVFTLIDAYVPLIVALIFYHPLEPGNPFFFVSMLTSVAGFYIPGWIDQG
jgi:hypothetical protein